MTIEKWLELAKKQIDALDAELILLFGLREALPAGADRSFLFAHPETGISQANWEKLDALLTRRAEGEPLAYIVGRKEFYGRDFQVDARVLIPRPETESLVDLALEVVGSAQGDLTSGEPSDGGLNEKVRKRAGESENRRILEIGTGSGCIAETLVLELTTRGVKTEVVATDISPAVLEVAFENAQRLGAKVQFLESDLLEKVTNGMDFDILMANLPYVDPKWGWITRKSLDFEPQEALYAAEKGLALYDRLLGQIGQFGAPRYLIFEADPCQHADLVQKTVEKGYVLDKILGFGLRFKRK